MMDKSFFEYIVILLNMIPFIKRYHNGETRITSTNEHIATGMVVSLLGCSLSRYSKWIFIGVAIHFLVYVFWKELWFDRFKNKGKPKGDVWAQGIERAIGYVFCIPLIVIDLY